MPIIDTNSRVEQSLQAIRTRIATITGLWTVYFKARQSADIGSDESYIVDSFIGGPVTPDGLGGSQQRRFDLQLQYMFFFPSDSGTVAARALAATIEEVLFSSGITLADGVPVMARSVMIGDVRDPTPQQSHYSMPVVITYYLIAL